MYFQENERERRGEQPQMANKIIDKGKINKEPENN